MHEGEVRQRGRPGHGLLLGVQVAREVERRGVAQLAGARQAEGVVEQRGAAQQRHLVHAAVGPQQLGHRLPVGLVVVDAVEAWCSTGGAEGQRQTT